MKNFLCALLFSALVLTSCASEPVDESTDLSSGLSTGGETSASVPEEFAGFALTVGDARLLTGETADVPTLLGMPKETLQAPSCIHEGNDTVYYYDGLEVTTSPSAAGDFILTIQITSEDITTEEGIRFGSSLDEVKAACGAYDEKLSSPDFGRYVFVRAGTSLTVLTDGDNTVNGITYTAEQ